MLSGSGQVSDIHREYRQGIEVTSERGQGFWNSVVYNIANHVCKALRRESRVLCPVNQLPRLTYSTFSRA